MMGFRKSAAQGVTDLLAAQHRALLEGDLDILGRLAPELERAFTRLHRDRGRPSDLAKIKEDAARNARLLTAAKAGVTAARAHLQSSRTSQLTTYGADGRSQATSPVVSSTLVRR